MGCVVGVAVVENVAPQNDPDVAVVEGDRIEAHDEALVADDDGDGAGVDR